MEGVDFIIRQLFARIKIVVGIAFFLNNQYLLVLLIFRYQAVVGDHCAIKILNIFLVTFN